MENRRANAYVALSTPTRACSEHYTGLDWPKVTAEALRFENAIAEYEPRCLEEMAGLAEGAGVEYSDILALNVLHRGDIRGQSAPGERRNATAG